MAGALRYFEYRSDNGNDYGVRLDRTNSNAVVTGTNTPLFASPGATVSGRAPQGLKLRYANAFSADKPNIRRSFPVGNLEAYTALATTANPRLTTESYPGPDDTPGSQETWIVSSLVGEKLLGIPNTLTVGSGLVN
jgi:hypothetical protein